MGDLRDDSHITFLNIENMKTEERLYGVPFGPLATCIEEKMLGQPFFDSINWGGGGFITIQNSGCFPVMSPSLSKQYH